jgi:phage tail sheath protein FI
VPITEVRSAGVYGFETNPAQAPQLISPAKMGLVGWTLQGPSNYPIQVQSVDEFTRIFGSYTSNGILPQAIRAFFGTGGQAAWVSRVVPADAVPASVSIDSVPGPTKWTFVANGEGTWGNSLAVRIRGNQNFLNPTTSSWDAFDVLILQPADFNPAFQDAVEVYSQVQFTDPSQANYILNAITDPRKPSLLVKLLAGAGGTPSGLLPAFIQGETVGTGGGAPLATRFVANLSQVPVLAGSLELKAVSSTTNFFPTTPTPAISGTNTSFSLSLVNIPLVDGSLQVFYQKLQVKNEPEAPSSGVIDGTNKVFTFNAGTILNPIHREIGFLRLKYAGATVGPTTLTTIGVTAAAYALATTPLTGPVHPGTVQISVNVNGTGLATISDDGAGNLIGSNGSLPGGGTINYDTGVMTGTTAVLVASSTVVANYDTSNIITQSKVATLELTGIVGTISVGDAVTGPGGAGGTVLTVALPNITVKQTSVPDFTTGAFNDTTSLATATISSVWYSDLQQGVPLIGSVTVDAASNTIDHVADPTATTLTSGQMLVHTAVAPLAGTHFYLDYTVLGFAYANRTGGLVGDVATGSLVNTETGAVTLVTTFPPIAGSTIDVSYQTGLTVFDNGLGQLIGDINAAGNNTIDYNAGAVDVTFNVPPPSGTLVQAYYTRLAQAIQFQLAGGGDGSVISRNDVSNPTISSSKKGIYALDLVEEPLNVVVPDFEGSSYVQNDIVSFCDARQDRFAIFSFANGFTVPQAVQYVLVTQAFDTKNAAIYYPNIYFVNDNTNLPELIPSSPFVAGVYAKTASNKNVGKSPAGIVDGALDAPNIVGPEVKVSRADMDNLYPARINPLFTSAATGFYVNGAVSLSNESRWHYVNARLLNNFLMYNTKLQLQWTLFENNGPALWLKVTQALTGYYASLFRLGYFAGQNQSQAFFVRCNSSNNNQTTVDQGKVIIDIGFSPNKPAEFVEFFLSQPASASTV